MIIDYTDMEMPESVAPVANLAMGKLEEAAVIDTPQVEMPEVHVKEEVNQITTDLTEK